MTAPPLWLIIYAKEMRQRGIGPCEFGVLVVRESARRIRGGDLETYFWQESLDSYEGISAILRTWDVVEETANA